MRFSATITATTSTNTPLRFRIARRMPRITVPPGMVGGRQGQ